MPKRFTDTNKWDKVWFQTLSPTLKCLWNYITDRCNHAGFWEVDFRTAGYYVGKKINPEEVKEKFKKQFIEMDEGKRWFLIDFIEFQYNCKIEELNPQNKAHQSIIRQIERYNIKGLLRSLEGDIQAPLRGGKEPYIRNKKQDKDQQGILKGDFEDRTECNCAAYFKEQGFTEEAGKKFYNYYQAQSWMTGGQFPRHIDDWHAKANEFLFSPDKMKWLLNLEDRSNGKSGIQYLTREELMEKHKSEFITGAKKSPFDLYQLIDHNGQPRYIKKEFYNDSFKKWVKK